MKCATCPAIRDCKQAFGKYWTDKSNCGDGCSYPFRGWNVKRPTLPPHRRRTFSQVTFHN